MYSACAAYTVPVHQIRCLCSRTQRLCSIYSACAAYTVPVQQIQCLCSRTQCLCSIYSACAAEHSACAAYTVPVQHIQCLCSIDSDVTFQARAQVAPTTRLRIMHARTEPACHHAARVPCSVLLAPPWQWLAPRPGRLVGLASPGLCHPCRGVGLLRLMASSTLPRPRAWRAHWRLCCTPFASHSAVRPAGLQFKIYVAM